MGVIAEGFAAFAQPLIDETDGSLEQVERALLISELCSVLAQFPENNRETKLRELQRSLKMDDDEFEVFRTSVVDPMVRRHAEMFAPLHLQFDRLVESAAEYHRLGAKAAEKYPGTDRYAPCPCNSGKKYKFCCGKRGS
jgi:hypothetical protein